MHMRFIVVDLETNLGEGDADKVLAAVRMTKGVASADWTEDNSAAVWGVYHRVRRVYANAVHDAIDVAEAQLRGPDGGIIVPPPAPRFE